MIFYTYDIFLIFLIYYKMNKSANYFTSNNEFNHKKGNQIIDQSINLYI